MMEGNSIIENKKSLRNAASTYSNRLHVVPTTKGWSLKKEGGINSHGIYKTKKEALSIAYTLGKKSLIVVHQKNGEIEKLKGDK